MTFPRLALLVISPVTLLALAGQTPRPHAYSLTEIYYLFEKPVTLSIYRDGSKVLLDRQNIPDQQPNYHLRFLYDLQTHNEVFWDVDNPANCNTTAFEDNELEWGGPFATEVARFKQFAQEIGTETIHEIDTKVYQQSSPGRTMEAWIEPKSGAAIKLRATVDGRTETPLEVLKLSIGKPPAEFFVIPSACRETLQYIASKRGAKR